MNTRNIFALITIFSLVGSGVALAMEQSVDVDGVTRVVVSESDLGQFSEEMIDGPLNGLISSASVKLFDGFAEVTAVTERPLKATLFVRAEITAANNKLYPKILKARYGYFPIPNFVINFLIGRLVEQGAKDFQRTGVATPGIEWHSVQFEKGRLTVEFKEADE